jgi:hypothetical protein
MRPSSNVNYHCSIKGEGRNSPLWNVCESLSLDDFEREQSHRLASNLDGFPREKVEIIADAVHGWCDGHPYLTQRLYALIDESREYRKLGVEQLSGAVKQLVEGHLLYGDDANLAHITNYLRDSKEYCDQVFKILKKEARKSVMLAEELLTIGIVKRLHDLRLSIRNEIYKEVLKNFFEGEEPEGRS